VAVADSDVAADGEAQDVDVEHAAAAAALHDEDDTHTPHTPHTAAAAAATEQDIRQTLAVPSRSTL
jgi:hypothetical protein